MMKSVDIRVKGQRDGDVTVADQGWRIGCLE